MAPKAIPSKIRKYSFRKTTEPRAESDNKDLALFVLKNSGKERSNKQ